ncbi:MAG: T9SS C-terminal target domain-containing protein [Bacteroidetes bacterium]|nr:MAG: T9SS C-terminal target domain-containing protein [Bacteroidota bacterium]
MKVLLSAMIMISCSLGLQSQNYHPFPQENAVWHALAFQFSESDYDYNEMFSHKYLIDGDTLIENQTWTKIFFTNQYLGDVEMRSDMNYIAAIRENEHKQILAKFPEFPEFVLYDFSLEVGDTIWYEYIAASVVSSNVPMVIWDEEDEYLHYKVVVAKDSVLLENGQYRNRLVLESFHSGYGDLHIINHWVEGLGCTRWSGLFHPIIVMRTDNGDGITFACFMQDEEVIYLDNPYCDDCLCESFSSIDSFDDTEETLIVYPNPAKGWVTIKISSTNSGNTILRMNDISGNKLFEKQVLNQPEIALDLSGHKSGIYIIQLWGLNNRLLDAKKVIVE